MQGIQKLFFVFLIILLLIPVFVFAANPSEIPQSGNSPEGRIISRGKEKILLDYDYLVEEYQRRESDENKMWRAVKVEDFTVDSKRQNIILRGQGEMNLVSPNDLNLSYKDFDALTINFFANQDLDLRIIPDISTTAKNTFELKKTIPAIKDFKEHNFSLRHPIFAGKVDHLGFNFISRDPVEIEIKSIKLYKKNFFGIIFQGIKDYFKTDTYSAYSSNFFPAPRIFGRFAFIYLFPAFLAGIFLFLRSKKYWEKGLIILAGLWLLTDLRMIYEFLSYQVYDYKTWVKPVYEKKIFRAENDFYQFADFVKERLPSDTEKVNFYGGPNDFFARKLQYLLYPIEVNFESQDAKIYVIYWDSSISFNSINERLYKDKEPISLKGVIIAPYYNDSFIFSNLPTQIFR